MRLDKDDEFNKARLRTHWDLPNMKNTWWLDLMAVVLVILIGYAHFIVFFRGL